MHIFLILYKEANHVRQNNALSIFLICIISQKIVNILIKITSKLKITI